jgi:hypothetical protein
MLRAGVLGFAAITVPMYVSRVMGLSKLDLPHLLGMLVLPAGWRARLVGLLPHAAASMVVFPLAYQSIFHASGMRPSGTAGMKLAAFHWLLSGVALWVVGLNPRLERSESANEPARGRGVESPGAFALNYGAFTAVSFALGHLLYGATLGVSMSRTAERRPAMATHSDSERLVA